MLRLVAVAAALLAAPIASASLLETLTSDAVAAAEGALGPLPVDHVHYQDDAGTGFDAPDRCQDAVAAPLGFELPVGGELGGLLVPMDDEADHYRVPVGQELVGSRVTVEVLGREATLPFRIDVAVPGCGSSVLDEGNQPAPPLAHPEPAEGQRPAQPDNLDPAGGGSSCSTRWFFVLNQFGDLPAPASIHAAWTDGSQADLPLLKGTPATLAQYAAPDNGFTLHSVTALVPEEWRGRFNVGEAPCGLVDGEAVFGQPAEASADGTRIEFTPVAAGTYVLAIRAVPPEAPDAPEAPAVPGVPTAVPASCHAICGDVLDTGSGRLSYDARSD